MKRGPQPRAATASSPSAVSPRPLKSCQIGGHILSIPRVDPDQQMEDLEKKKVPSQLPRTGWPSWMEYGRHLRRGWMVPSVGTLGAVIQALGARVR